MNRHECTQSLQLGGYISERDKSMMYLNEIKEAFESGGNIPIDSREYFIKTVNDLERIANNKDNNSETSFQLSRVFKLDRSKSDLKADRTKKYAWRNFKIYMAHRYGIAENSDKEARWEKLSVYMVKVDGVEGLPPKEIAQYIESPENKSHRLSVKQIRNILKRYPPVES